MKYVVFLFLFLVSTSFNSYARSITSFQQSSAITTVLEVMNDTAQDLKTFSKISDKKFKLNSASNCVRVESEDAVHAFYQAAEQVLHVFPDEEYPLEDAINDLEDYLDHQSYMKCEFASESEKFYIQSLYYFDGADKIHLKVDNLTLK